MAARKSAFDFQQSSPDLRMELESFRDFLKAKGHRVTRERVTIAEAVLLNRGHFDVDELYLDLKTRSGISKASIYRTIPLLIESGLLAAVYLENGHMHYERAYGREHHSHLRCTACGRIFEFSAPELPALEKTIAEQKNFKSEGHKFEIWGLCSNCRA
jgi:Fur family ferric uptake transcriptional regulator